MSENIGVAETPDIQSELLEESQEQTRQLKKINDKLGFFVLLIILGIIISVLGFCLSV